MMLQLNPQIPVVVIKDGKTYKGFAMGWLDYSQDHNLLWIVALNDSGEIWIIPNNDVRAVKNYSMLRIIKEKRKK